MAIQSSSRTSARLFDADRTDKEVEVNLETVASLGERQLLWVDAVLTGEPTDDRRLLEMLPFGTQAHRTMALRRRAVGTTVPVGLPAKPREVVTIRHERRPRSRTREAGLARRFWLHTAQRLGAISSAMPLERPTSAHPPIRAIPRNWRAGARRRRRHGRTAWVRPAADSRLWTPDRTRTPNSPRRSSGCRKSRACVGVAHRAREPSKRLAWRRPGSTSG